MTHHATGRSAPAVVIGRLPVFLLGTIALLLSGCGRHAPAASAQASEPSPVAGEFRITTQQAVNLRIAAAGVHPFRDEIRTEGRIAPDGDRLTQVFSPYSGRVTRVLVSPGDHVKAGAPLLEIEASEFAQAQNDLLAADASARSAESQLELAHTTEQRRHALYEAKGASLQDWQQSQAELAAADSTLRSAQAGQALVRNRLRILGRSDAEVAALESSGHIDPSTRVVAPIAGVVTDRQVGVGQYLQAGASNPQFTIGDASRVWLVGEVRENEAGALRVGQAVEVRVAALPGRVFAAHLSYIAPAVDPATHRLAVRAAVANPGALLRPEMFAAFTVVTGREQTATAIPASAVVRDGVHARAWVAARPELLVARELQLGRERDGLVEVLSGLAPGEKVVTDGTLFIDRAGSGD